MCSVCRWSSPRSSRRPRWAPRTSRAWASGCGARTGWCPRGGRARAMSRRCRPTSDSSCSRAGGRPFILRGVMAEELAPMKEQVYKDPRPKEYFDRFHERARKREPDPMYELVRSVVAVVAYGFFRMRAIAGELVPASGPVILAPNHFSFFDHFFLAVALRRKVRFMAKSQLFKPPMQFVYTHGGVFPVRRGHRDEDAFITSGTILERGGCVAMYCEGGRSRTGRLSEQAKPGIGRLALETG